MNSSSLSAAIHAAIHRSRKPKIALLAGAMFAPVEHTHASDDSDVVLEEILVTGIRGSLVSALQTKRFEESIVDGIAAEDLGKFPDQNVAESLQRITGVAIDRGAGEGTRISIRGFGPQFNTVLLNNRILPTDDGGRAFSFDLLASELISGADVYKTPRAAMTEGGIGGLVNVSTARPLDIQGFKVAGAVKGVYDSLDEGTNPYASVLVSNNLDNKLGLLASLAYQKRDARIDSAEIGGYRMDNVIVGSSPNDPTTPEPVWRPQSASQNYQLQDRERIGGTLALQWAPSDDLLVTADALYSELTVDDNLTQLSRWFSNPIYNSIIDENNTVVSFTRVPKPLVSQGVYQLWENGARLGTGQWNSLNQQSANRDVATTMFGLNLDWQASNNLTLGVDLQTSSAKSRAVNNAGVTLANPTQVATDFAFNGDSLNFPDPGVDFSATADAYYANNVGFTTFDREDDITEARLDAEWKFDDFGIVESVRSGIYYSDRHKELIDARTNFSIVTAAFRGFRYNAPAGILHPVSPSGGLFSGGFVRNFFTYDPQELVSFFLSDAVEAQASNVGAQIINNFQNGDPTYATLAEAQAAADAATASALAAIQAAQAYVPSGSAGHPLGAFAPEYNAGRSNRVTEETQSAYVEAQLRGENWSGNIGLRYVSTDTQSWGTGNELTGFLIDTPAGSGVLSVASGQPISASASYNRLLPSMNFKYEFASDFVARLAHSETLTRPQLAQLTPTQNFSGTGVFDAKNQLVFNGTITGQNVNLKPYLSKNIDVSLEWYYSEDSYIGLAYFHKDIEDWITTQTRDVIVTVPTIVDGVAGGSMILPFSQTAPFNNDSSDAQGIELAALHNFENGFGVQFNYTYIDSSAEFRPGQTNFSFTLDGLSKNSYNLITYYEKDRWQARMAYNWRSDYVNCATCSRSGQPVQTEEYGQLDVSASYDVSDNLSVFVEGVNITDEETRTFSTYESRFLGLTTTGARFSFGFRGVF